MEKDELNKIIERIENENSKEKAFFGIYNIEHEDEAYIKANKNGLELLACKLLKASMKVDEVIDDEEKNIIPFDYREKWISGDIYLAHIQPKSEDGIDIEEKEYKRNWKDEAAKYGCIITIGILIIIFITGIVSVISWFT